MASKISTRFCVFCYRNDNHSINEITESENFHKFLKLLGRFTGDSDNELEKQMHVNQLDKLSLSNVLGCCDGCVVIVNEFCDTYHQFKCLEMELEWKIEKFVNIIKLANKIPSRVAEVTKALSLQQTKDGKSQLTNERENLNVVTKFRHSFSKQCSRRLKKRQPRVFINMTLAAMVEPPNSKNQSLEQLSNGNPITEINNAPLNTELEKPNNENINQIVTLDPLKTISEISGQGDPLTTIIVQNCVAQDIIDDTDSTADQNYGDDFLNCSDLSEDEIHKQTSCDPVQNLNKRTETLIHKEQEFPDTPVRKENVTERTEQIIPQPPKSASLIIENIFTQLPLPLNEVLSKTSLCTICKQHFISEDWLNKHIKNDHNHISSKIINPANPQVESGNPNKDTYLMKPNNNTSVPTTSSQQRYSLREKRSTVKYNENEDINDGDNNEMDYTAEESCSSSNTSDSEPDVKPFETFKFLNPSTVLKPIKTSKEIKPENSKDKKEYTRCTTCNKKTAKKLLETHQKTWHDKTGLEDTQIKKCDKPNCLAYFLTQEQLTIHQRNEHHAQKFTCHVCHRTFSLKLLLKQHLRQVHNKTLKNKIKCLEDQHLKPKEFKCNFCQFMTISPTKLAIHETEHALQLSEDPLNSKFRRCPRCPYKYSKNMQRRYLVHHLRHHLNYLTGESSGACELCSGGKAYVENTKQHFDLHHNTDLLDDPTKIFKCTECPSYYLKSFQLHRHKIRIHPSKTCEICEKTFKSRHGLLGHMRKYHTDYQQNLTLPVPCDWPNCVKRFGTDAELQFHKIYSHKRNPEEKKGSVICEICGSGFISVGRLKVHREKVHVEKNWVCNECGKSFKTKSCFEIHLEYHKGPESWKFECKDCGKKCMDKWKLASHMNTHTKEKPYVCQFCGEKYAHRHNWRGHLKAKHMDEEGVEEIVNSKTSQRKGNYLSRKGTKKGDCIYGT